MEFSRFFASVFAFVRIAYCRLQAETACLQYMPSAVCVAPRKLLMKRSCQNSEESINSSTVHPFVQQFIHSFIHLFIYSFIHSPELIFNTLSTLNSSCLVVLFSSCRGQVMALILILVLVAFAISSQVSFTFFQILSISTNFQSIALTPLLINI